MPEFEIVDTGRARLRVALEGDGPLVIMVHGFPESWYSWRHQMSPLAEAGFRAVAIDVRGYGGSDKPKTVDAYRMEEMVADVAGVASALAPGEKAVIVGHDWGAPIVWNTAIARPDVVRAVVGLSVPHAGAPARSYSEGYEAATAQGMFHYHAYFQPVGPAEAEAESDVRNFLRRFYYSVCGEAPEGAWPMKGADAKLLDGMADPAEFPGWLTPADLDYYVGEFERSGFFGPISRYRNFQRDHAWMQAFKPGLIQQPAMFIAGDRDPARGGFSGTKDPIAVMKTVAPNFRGGRLLEDCGHWTQQERPREVNALLLDFLRHL
jgi:pimeloyl-ACP methyl ester carboxylesterase